jgi:hypothetical protein
MKNETTPTLPLQRQRLRKEIRSALKKSVTKKPASRNYETARAANHIVCFLISDVSHAAYMYSWERVTTGSRYLSNVVSNPGCRTGMRSKQ